VIAHNDVGVQSNRAAPHSIAKNALEGLEIARISEQLNALCGPVHDVEHDACSGYSRSPWHDRERCAQSECQ
jgi:hypothetical protein